MHSVLISTDQVTVNPGMKLTVERKNRLFAELDRTDLIKHSIDAGGHGGPVKQLPHRTPFSLQGKMEEMIGQI